MTTRDETLVERCERLEATVTTWREVFQGIEAHLLDRINMRDPASPQTYLDIIRSDIANINRDSDAIVNARWADRARDSAEIARLTAEVTQVTGERDRQYDENVNRIAAEGAANYRALSAERALAKAREALEEVRAFVGKLEPDDLPDSIVYRAFDLYSKLTLALSQDSTPCRALTADETSLVEASLIASSALVATPSPDAATVERCARELDQRAETIRATRREGEAVDALYVACELSNAAAALRALPQAGGEGPRPQVVGRVTGKIYEGDQVPGMLHAICHACGLKDYPCTNPDCPNASSITNGKRGAE